MFERRRQRLAEAESHMCAAVAVLEKLAESDDALAAFFRALKDIWTTEAKIDRLAVCTGHGVARLLNGARDFEQGKSLDEAVVNLVASLRNNTEGISGDGALRLPDAVARTTESRVGGAFLDIVVPRLLRERGLETPDALMEEGPYELGAVQLRAGDVVLDCGANMGLFSALASSCGCAVYAFEPMEYIRDAYLSKTAEMNPNITVVPVAVGDEEAEAEFELDTGNLGSSHQRKDGAATAKPTQRVHVTTIDNFVRERGLERVDFIKADIEGAERHMLKGAAGTLRRFHPKLAICTYHLPDDPQVLRQLILEAEPRYTIVEKYKKMYAWVAD